MSELSKETLFTQCFAYHHNLVTRRWQYLVVYLALNGFMWSAIRDIKDDPILYNALAVTALLTTMIFLRLVSRMRRRLRSIGWIIKQLSPISILDVGELGGFGKKGITFWLYMAMLALSIPWFFVIYENGLIFWPTAVAFTLNFVFLRWRYGGWRWKKELDKQEEQRIEIENTFTKVTHKQSSSGRKDINPHYRIL